MEFERLCERPNRGSTKLTVPISVPVPSTPAALLPLFPSGVHVVREFGPFFCSSILSSPKMASNSDS